MRSAFSLQVSATVVLCHVKLMSGVLSLEVREQMLCSGLCNSAATSIVYLFTSFLGSFSKSFFLSQRSLCGNASVRVCVKKRLCVKASVCKSAYVIK